MTDPQSTQEQAATADKFDAILARHERDDLIRSELLVLDLEFRRNRALSQERETQEIKAHNAAVLVWHENEKARSARYIAHLDEWSQLMRESIGEQKRSADALERIASALAKP